MDQRPPLVGLALRYVNRDKRETEGTVGRKLGMHLYAEKEEMGRRADPTESR